VGGPALARGNDRLGREGRLGAARPCCDRCRRGRQVVLARQLAADLGLLGLLLSHFDLGYEDRHLTLDLRQRLLFGRQRGLSGRLVGPDVAQGGLGLALACDQLALLARLQGEGGAIGADGPLLAPGDDLCI
jgi:hypothetical protein